MIGIDLFSGCGGMTLGFEMANIRVIKAYEYWDEAIKCYKKNFEHPIEKADLSNYKLYLKDISGANPDIIFGGPPCQDFSHAGKRLEGNRADLTRSFAEIVASVRPKWYVMENVDRSRNSLAYKGARKILKDSGYGITEVVLDASLCGAPQKRKRFFSIGLQNSLDGFLLYDLKKNLSNSPMTIRAFFNGVFDVEFYYRHPRNYSRRAIFSIDEPSPTIRGVNRPVPAGYTGHPNDPVKIDGIRELSTFERSLIQTFPKDFIFPSNSKTTNEQLIGNAVPIKLAEYVAKAVFKHHLAYVCTRKENQLIRNL
ncbi:DNA cytosine methyltransferase [Lunatimonas salinarum]|uniref:DNA cytosine methyltransferase n=1 Tax=Lunatimonas salinarum TaxID=1774590 RepID=UPI001ADFD34A|nr:DNA cytosine methyltransferase [Lunatimonas salinarum]